MRVLGSKDIASLSLCGSLGESSISSLSLLYAPLLGVEGVGLYLLLYGIASSHRPTLGFESISRQSGMTLREIDDGMKKLEALGLLQTFVNEEGEARYFSLYLYPPLSPKGFFEDFLLEAKFRERIGEEDFLAWAKNFEKKELPKGAKEITVTYEEVFGERMPDMNRGFAGSEADGPAKIKTGFDVSRFGECLSSRGFSSSFFSIEELEYIEKAHALYGYDSGILGEFASDCVQVGKPFGEKLDRKAFLKKCQGNFSLKYLHAVKTGKSELQGEGILSKKAKYMDELAPVRYLTLRQRGHEPAQSDIRILNRLAFDIGLPAPAINAVVDYVLATNNGVLNGALAEKIAASLVRKGIDNARDAMDDLYATKMAGKKRKGESKQSSFSEGPSSVHQEDSGDDDISDEELNALLAGLGLAPEKK